MHPVDRAQILEAALLLCSRHGFRRTSMDAIAAEAGVAKASLYAHFASKEDLCREACGHFADGFVAAAEAARSTPELHARLVRMLEAEFLPLCAMIDRSPHGHELVAVHSSLGTQAIENGERRLKEMLAAEIAAAVAAGQIRLDALQVDAASAAGTLHRFAHAASHKTRDSEEQRQHLSELVRYVLVALRPD